MKEVLILPYKLFIKPFFTFKKKILKSYYKMRVRLTAASIASEPLRVNGYSRVTDTTYLGKNVNFNGMIISGCGTVKIGDNFHSGKYCQIISEIHNYKGTSLPYDNKFICKDVTIEDNVWLGNNVIILGGVTIGEGSIIQAGSVVVKDIEPLSIAGGHPAKTFTYRDKNHYNKLKEEGKFM